MVRHFALRNLYETEKTIGSGGFAKVKLAKHLMTGEKVAIKIMDKQLLGDDLPRVKMEIDALKSLSHHHICRLYQVIETNTHYYLVMEYCAGGELFDHIVQCQRLSEMESRSFFRQILSAVAYLHSKGYVHRDLKPENVLLDKDQCIKLIDFGLCAKPSSISSHLDTSCGSPTYAAPELIMGAKYIGARVDVWSMGVMLYALLCGRLPFEGETIEEMYKKILSGDYTSPAHLSEGSKKFIRCMLEIDPSKRITIDELLCHPWVQLGYNEPVSITSLYKDSELQKNCVEIMAAYYSMSYEEMWQKLSNCEYDHFAATYHLLVSLKSQGLPLKLRQYALRSTRGRTQQMSGTVSGKSNLNGTCLIHPTSETPNEKDDIEHKIMQPPEFTPVKKPRKRPRSLNREASQSPAPKKQATQVLQDINKSIKDKNYNNSVPSTPEMKTSSPCARLINSLDRKVRHVRKALTPGRPWIAEYNLPLRINPKEMSNISTTTSRNPRHVKEELIKALRNRGIDCKIKGFSLRGKLYSSDGKKCILSFELEICYIADVSDPLQMIVVIRRKRLKGDAWNYKCICEEILNLANIK